MVRIRFSSSSSSISAIISKPSFIRIMVWIGIVLMILLQSKSNPWLMMSTSSMDNNDYYIGNSYNNSNNGNGNAENNMLMIMKMTKMIFPTTTTTKIKTSSLSSNKKIIITNTTEVGKNPDTATRTTTTVVDIDNIYNNDDDIILPNNNIAVALISFGNATQTKLVERTIRSIQSRGQWNSPNIPIIIITDKKRHYESIFQMQQQQQQLDDNNSFYDNKNPIIVLYPNREDWEDIQSDQFKQIKLKYKRIKTRLLDYLDLDDRLSNVRHVLYLDIDIVVCQPITPFLNRYITKYQNQITDLAKDSTTTLANAMTATTAHDNDDYDSKPNNKNNNKNNTASSSSLSLSSSPYSWMMAFEGRAGQGKAVHSGVMFLDRKYSQGCLQEWRELIDNGRDKYIRDQESLRIMRKRSYHNNNNNNKQQATTTTTTTVNGGGSGCNFLLWKPNNNDMIFPKPNDFLDRHYPVFLHITNTHHVHLTNFTIQQSYLEDALLLDEKERQSNMSLAKLTTTAAATASSSINITF